MNNEKRLVPKLRFPEFTHAWEQRKLGEITNSYSGGTPSVSNRN
ncbi:restriction endonuclease subunit S, partial [Histophilus somni]